MDTTEETVRAQESQRKMHRRTQSSRHARTYRNPQQKQ